MTTAFVLMTAMPPTKGHKHLIEFASSLDVDETAVLVCTQPDEPYGPDRWLALSDAFQNRPNIFVYWLNRELEQNPDAPGFWEMWDEILTSYGAKPGDYYVSSEMYGQTLADRLGGKFFPYDVDRELYYTKATRIRNDPNKYFDDILDEFQPYLTRRVTIFGAESTGKTTLSKELSYHMNGHWLFEWARPYLENMGGPVVTRQNMMDIWKGQMATQFHASNWTGKPWIIQDTDLFSTVGYWKMHEHPDDLGDIPEGLVVDADMLQSDLYIITKSNIPFEEDPIRYGGNVRESSDQYWIDICERFDLNYVVLESCDLGMREAMAATHMYDLWDNTVAANLDYERSYN